MIATPSWQEVNARYLSTALFWLRARLEQRARQNGRADRARQARAVAWRYASTSRGFQITVSKVLARKRRANAVPTTESVSGAVVSALECPS
jgi:hypothetical protein